MDEAADELSALEGYAAWAPHYDGDGNPLIALEGPDVRSWIGRVGGRRGLDLGCGTGRHALAMVERGMAEVVGLDASPEMLDRARRRPDADRVLWVRQTLPGPLPLADGAFDLAVLGLVAEHLDDLAGTFREVARVLAEGGHCVVSALHPERTAEGQRARFIDPETGLRRPIATIHREVADYLDAAAVVGLSLVEERSLVVPQELAEVLPRAARYVGKPLGWVGCWQRGPRSGPGSGDIRRARSWPRRDGITSSPISSAAPS